MTRYHNYTKLNQIDLQNSITLFQYNLKHNMLELDTLDMDADSKEQQELQAKFELDRQRKALEKSFNTAEPTISQ